MKKKGGSIDQAKFWEVHKKLTNRRKEPKSTAINDKNGQRTESPSQILEVYKEFYETLLTPQESTSPEQKQQAEN